MQTPQLNPSLCCNCTAICVVSSPAEEHVNTYWVLQTFYHSPPVGTQMLPCGKFDSHTNCVLSLYLVCVNCKVCVTAESLTEIAVLITYVLENLGIITVTMLTRRDCWS
jgi:hypothetical protein